jgi:hypothetical protein
MMVEGFMIIELSTGSIDGIYSDEGWARDVLANHRELHPWGLWTLVKLMDTPRGAHLPRFHADLLDGLPYGVTDRSQGIAHALMRDVQGWGNRTD